MNAKRLAKLCCYSVVNGFKNGSGLFKLSRLDLFTSYVTLMVPPPPQPIQQFIKKLQENVRNSVKAKVIWSCQFLNFIISKNFKKYIQRFTDNKTIQKQLCEGVHPFAHHEPEPLERRGSQEHERKGSS